MSSPASHHTPAHSALHPALKKDNITFAPGSGGVGVVLAIVGVVAIAAAFALAKFEFSNTWARQALFSYHVGSTAVLAPCLCAVIFLMIFNLLNAGWVATLRRQFENVASFLPFAFILVMGGVIADLFILDTPRVMSWHNAANHADELLVKKWAWWYFPAHATHGEGSAPVPLFFLVRCALYGAVWTYLSRRLIGLSKKQDQARDPSASSELAAQARFTSAWGLLVMALTTAFASFDWLMGTDFRFFSTMWGVYYFAGGSFCLFAIVGLIMAIVKGKGKLETAVTAEHFHDLGKLLFSFTVFWGYIAFSQYFLIWYSNIPEETSYFLYRKQNGWQYLGIFLILGHFVLPFLFLISRHIKKSFGLYSFAAVFAIIAHLADIFWIVRPMAYATEARADQLPGAGAFLIDILAILGVVMVFAGYLVRTVASGPLVGVNEPYMNEGLEHRNYV